MQALQSFSVGDNHLQALPAGMSALLSLKQLWAYGNQLQGLPHDLLSMPAITRKAFASAPLCSSLCTLAIPLAASLHDCAPLQVSGCLSMLS